MGGRVIGIPPLFWVWLAGGAALLTLAAWRLRLRWQPAWLIRVGLLGLALVAALLPETRSTVNAPPERTVLIIDQSDSLAPDDRGQARAQARQWLDAGENRLVIVAGAGAEAVTGDVFHSPDGSETDLAAAVDLAAAFLGRQPGRVVIATDGYPGDPLAFDRAIRNLQALADHRIQLIPLRPNAFPADSTAGRIYLPGAMWENSSFTAVIPVDTFLPGDVELVVSVNEEILLEETLNLPAGSHLVPVGLGTTGSEIMTIAVETRTDGDPRPENNRAFAALQVFPAPRVLLVTENAGTARDFAGALAEAGLDSDLIVPEDLPDSLADLSIYQVIVVDNILAADLAEGQMRALKDFVQQLGRGLIFMGGRNAFTLGGYQDTVIEPILPVRLEPPPREQNSPLTLVLVLDRSASMDGPRGTPNNLRPIALAREAALRSVETLGPEDYLGILSYNANAVWSLPIQSAGNGDILQQAKDAMAALSPSGGTAIFNALDAAVTGMIENPTSETRHIVLLSDGNDDASLEQYTALVEAALAEEITISTIALGVEADRELMAFLAEAGRGRYYAVLEATDLPKILIDESQAARDENVHEGEVFPIVGEANHPVLSGLSVSEMPALGGYNALESRAEDGAEDVLLSASFEDPLLSVWQYGLGRVAAWTGDLGGDWGRDWAAWDGWPGFWSNVIRYTLPDPALGPGEVSARVAALEMAVSARIVTGAGVPRSGVPVSFSMAGPNGEVRTYPVPQVAPGLYELTLPRPEDGVYRGVVEYADETGVPVEVAAPVVVNYPAEWRPAVQPPNFTAGELTTWDTLLEQGEASESAVLSPNQVLQRLLLALLVLWPVEIAIRRRWMPWR